MQTTSAACNTARLVGLDDRGDITPVLRADLAIIRPYERFVVDATAFSTEMRLPNVGPGEAELVRAEKGMRAAGLL